MLEKLKKNAASLLLLFALISSLFYAFNALAWQSDFDSLEARVMSNEEAAEKLAEKSDLDNLEARVIFNEKAAEKKELMKTVFECKKLYGSDYSAAPDEFTSKFCRDAEIKLKNMK